MPLALAALPVLAAAPAASAYDQAVALRQAGRPAEAARLLQTVLEREPGNADARLQLGYAQLALGNLAAAESAFRAVLAQAPDYADARQGLALVAERRAAEGPHARLDVDAGMSAVKGQPDWRELDAQLRVQANPGLALTGRVEATRRFGLDDVYAEGRVDARLSDRVDGYVSLGGTPQADYRPMWQVGGGLAARLGPHSSATLVSLDARAAHYRSGDVSTLTPGVQQYVAGGRAWLTAQWINLFADGHHQMGVLGRGDLQASERLRLFAGAARAPDTSEGVVTRVTSVFGGAVLALDSRHELRLAAAHVVPTLGARRVDLTAGLGIRF